MRLEPEVDVPKRKQRYCKIISVSQYISYIAVTKLNLKQIPGIINCTHPARLITYGI